jgi:hypothetical protein
MSAVFHIHNGLKQVDALSPLCFKFTLEYATRNVQENTGRLDTSHSGLC